ncbi:MAG TPA: AbrB/MazE/SpoVT family DNA-binding domain-containing protein [Verrucomicrobiota bacterium]|nr:AbrB/MazE/SpoVT family DNA-binding domain-containing protein [Verrucomicrobiota bacterium]HRZ38221.1 AbrB/MazE/SpoVT family DNA-binding domain-containing protein [Candidatus Paceibacterota bacterium]HRZ54998.1 AbrB/MazE/SpoVT family DNA-binding domain-containing protein [Candidatus Paceibacterota bacterium]
MRRTDNHCRRGGRVLQDAGLSCFEYVEQLTLLLFLKMADQLTEPPHHRAAIVAPELGWKALLPLDGPKLEDKSCFPLSLPRCPRVAEHSAWSDLGLSPSKSEEKSIEIQRKTGKTFDVITARLSTKGQLVIPSRLRKALHLQPGDKVSFTVEGERLVLQRDQPQRARLVRGKFGRPVLVTPPGAPPMTPERVKAILEELS